jgi:RNA polymerase sigma-70 factor (ECF subfamily)
VSAVFRASRTDFDRLYRRHVACVYRYAYAVLGNHADAEDVTQQTFLNAYRAISEGTKPRNAENWLLTIAHNEVRRHFRSAQGKPREVELDEQVADIAPEHMEPSVADIVRALQHLPPIQRSALVMREFEGRSYAEIAQILNVTQSALEALIFRARRALAEQLEGELTCAEAEQALSRRLDGRLPRRESRRLKAHLRDCAVCVRFAGVQKRQSSMLKGLSVMPIPASLFLFRGEQAAAAGLGTSAVASGGSTAIAGGGATGIAAAFAAKAAAVAATVGVAGGVGYTVAKPETATTAEPNVAAAVAEEPQSRPIAAVAVPKRRSDQLRPARPQNSRSQRKVNKPRPAASAFPNARKIAAARSNAHAKVPPVAKAGLTTPPARKPKPLQPKARTRPDRGKKTGRIKPARAKPVREAPAAEKPLREADPAPPTIDDRRGPKN